MIVEKQRDSNREGNENLFTAFPVTVIPFFTVYIQKFELRKFTKRDSVVYFISASIL